MHVTCRECRSHYNIRTDRRRVDKQELKGRMTYDLGFKARAGSALFALSGGVRYTFLEEFEIVTYLYFETAVHF